MKNLLKLAACLALALPLVAGAQTYSPQTVSLGVATISAGGTSNINATLDVRRSENVALALKFNCGTATNVVPLTILFDKSLDGSNWSDKDTFSWSYIRDGTTNSIVASTNISTGGYGYFRLKSIAAPGAAGLVTLESFAYSVKNPSR